MLTLVKTSFFQDADSGDYLKQTIPGHALGRDEMQKQCFWISCYVMVKWSNEV